MAILTSGRGSDLRSLKWVRYAMVPVAAAGFGLLYLVSASFRSEVDRAAAILGRSDIAALRDYMLSFGVWAPVVSASLMVLQALAAPLPAFVLAFANGLAYGAFWGGVLSLASATLASALCFGVSRLLGRRLVEALVGSRSLGSADRWFERWGAYAVLVARLVPIVSFDMISYAAGLTRMRFAGFLVATVIGAAPATFVYSYLGGEAPRYANLLMVVFGVAISAGVITAVVRRHRRGEPVPLYGEDQTTEEHGQNR